MGGRNFILNRGIPVQINDPAVLATLVGKGVVRYVDPDFLDMDGNVIAVSGVSDASLAAHYVVQQNQTTGAFQVNSVDIPAAIPLTFAAMQALDHTQYGTLFFLCTDKHSVGTTGGSLWQNDAVGNRVVLRDDPLVFALLSDAPNPVTYPGLRILPGNVGHVCKSDGVTYRIEPSIALLSNTLADIPHPGTYTTEALLKSIQIPVDVNNNSILQNGDSIVVDNAWCQKTGTVNIITRRYLLGTSVTVGDYTAAASGQVLATTEAGATVLGRVDTNMNILRLSATTCRIDHVITPSGTFNVGGPVTAARDATTVTTTSFDSPTPPSLHYGAKLNGTTDTAFNLLRGYRVSLKRGY